MLLAIPHLFPPDRLREAVAGTARLPAFETLLARGTRTRCAAEGLETGLGRALGIPCVQDFPAAPITLEADRGVAGPHYWLRADPVHLRVMRDRLVLADSGLLNLSLAESTALAQAVGAHFGAAFSPHVLHASRWYLRFESAPRVQTTPLSCAIGRDVDTLLPRGDDAMKFRAWLNEVQMLLFEHPLNQARETRGELSVNSLWLWGGGVLPAPVRSTLSLYSDDADARALGRFAAAAVHALPKAFSGELLDVDALIVLDQLTASGQYGDAFGWRDALGVLERDWFAPLLHAPRNWPAAGIQLLDPVSGHALQLHRRDRWKFWRRPQAATSF